MFKKIKNELINEIVKKVSDKICDQYIGKINTMEIKKGDMFIINYKKKLSDEEFERFKIQLKDWLPDNKTIILEGDVNVDLLTKEQIKKAV